MKLGRLVDARFHTAFQKLAAQPVPLRVAFKLKGILAKINQEIQKHEECRHHALEKYGKSENGKLVMNPDNSVVFEPENLQLFAQELTDLGNTDVEIPFVTLAEIGDNVKLSTEELDLLDGVVVE